MIEKLFGYPRVSVAFLIKVIFSFQQTCLHCAFAREANVPKCFCNKGQRAAFLETTRLDIFS